jgi:enoyl-CoA hydratase
MTTGSATLDIDGAIATLRFSNPDNGYMDDAMERDLVAAVERIEGDESIRACVLTGADPGVFIRHYDVSVLSERSEKLAARGLTFTTDRPVPEGGIHKAMRMMEEGATAYIAALNGTAMGGGFELSLACDFRLVAAGPYQFGLPEINLGILPGAGGTQRLPRLLGEAAALRITLLGDVMDPIGLHATGLTLELVEGDVVGAARAVAEKLAAKPPAALAHIKRLVRRAQAGDPAGGFADERTLFCDLMVRADARSLMADMAAGNRTITDYPDG